MADFDEQKRMKEILVKLHHNLVTDNEEDDGETEEEVEFVEGMSYERAVLFAQVSLDSYCCSSIVECPVSSLDCVREIE